jgi:hypothetical protein
MPRWKKKIRLILGLTKNKFKINASGLLTFLNKNRTVNVLSFLAGLFLLLGIFSNFSAYAFQVYFNSDTLYLPSVYKDLFIDKHYIKDWHLNPAPNFFPDMLLYFTMMLFSSGNFIVVSFVFSVIQFFAILLLFRYIFKLVMPGDAAGYFKLVFILFSFFLLEYLFLGKDFAFTFYVLSNSYHTGAFVMSLVALSLFLNYLKRYQKNRLIVLFILSIICVVSDKLFIVLFSLPAFFTMLFFYKKHGAKVTVLFLLMLVFSVFVGIKLFEFLEDSDFTEFDKPHRILSFANIKTSFDILFQQVSIYMSEFSFKGMALYLFFSGLLARIVFFFYIRRKKSNGLISQYVFFSICFDVVVFIAPVLNGNYTGFDTLRYNIYPLYSSALNNAMLVAYIVNNSALKAYSLPGKWALTTVVIFLLGLGMLSFSRLGLKRYFFYYPSMAKQIDAMAKQNELKCGVADYWNAKKTSMFSKNSLRVYSVFEDLGAYEHVTNRQWFYGNNVFNYVIVNKLSDTLSFHPSIKPIHIIPLEWEGYLIKTPEFRYDREVCCKPIVISK